MFIKISFGQFSVYFPSFYALRLISRYVFHNIFFSCFFLLDDARQHQWRGISFYKPFEVNAIFSSVMIFFRFLKNLFTIFFDLKFALCMLRIFHLHGSIATDCLCSIDIEEFNHNNIFRSFLNYSEALPYYTSSSWFMQPLKMKMANLELMLAE